MKRHDIIEDIAAKNAVLVAVTKTRSKHDIMPLYNEGIRIMGENRVQELLDKKDDLPSDIQWHLIGHLQTNKVKYIASFIQMIHSVDSLKLVKEINKYALKYNRVIDILIQCKVAKEESKFGVHPDLIHDFIEDVRGSSFSHIRIRGIMGMGTLTKDQGVTASEFKALKTIFDDLKHTFFSNDPDFNTLSMGMSSDYKIALEEGSTMVRIGSALF